MVAAGNFARKCPTLSIIELTWPGVPVTACASIRPCRSKMPADRSPASRTVVLKAVRIMVCACSSTTATSRFHMIWRWISASAAASLDSAACPWPWARGTSHPLVGHQRASSKFDVAPRVDAGLPARPDQRAGFILGDDRGTAQRGAPTERRTVEHRPVRTLRRGAVPHRPGVSGRGHPSRAGGWRRRFGRRVRPRRDQHGEAHDLDVAARHRPIVEMRVLRVVLGADRRNVLRRNAATAAPPGSRAPGRRSA